MLNTLRWMWRTLCALRRRWHDKRTRLYPCPSCSHPLRVTRDDYLADQPCFMCQQAAERLDKQS